MPAVADVAGKTQIGPSDLDRATRLERELLACCLRSPQSGGDGLDQVIETIDPEDFAVHAHRLVFRACLDLHEAKEPITLTTVFDRLRITGQAKELGPNPALWLADVWELQETDIHAGYFAAKVREAALLRRLRRAAVDILSRADKPNGPAADVVSDCEQLVFELSERAGSTSGPRAAADMVREALARIDERAGRGDGPCGVVTGFDGIDDYLSGLKPGQLIVVGARPGAGKTSLGLCVALNAVEAGVPVLFASMEMPEAEIMDRALAARSGVPLRNIERGSLDGSQAGRVTAAAAELKGQPFSLDCTPDLSAARLASEMRRAVRRRSVGLVVVDYLQLMRPENPRENRNQQVGLLARRIKQAARMSGVPVLLACQLNREVEHRDGGKPRLGDLRESGEIEQHADAVLLLAPHSDQPEESPVWLTDVIIAKNRNGPTGEVTLSYCRPLARFENAPK